jgi:hypothetical protein
MDSFILFIFLGFFAAPLLIVTYLYIARRHKMEPYFFVMCYKWLAVIGAFVACLYIAK